MLIKIYSTNIIGIVLSYKLHNFRPTEKKTLSTVVWCSIQIISVTKVHLTYQCIMYYKGLQGLSTQFNF